MIEIYVLYAAVVLLSMSVVAMAIKIRALQVRPSREYYTRATAVIGRTQVDAGLEWREHDPPIVGHDLWQVCKNIAQRAHFIPPMDAMISAEPDLDSKWPDRAWFLEVGDVDGGSYAQGYQPWGRPKWRHSSKRHWWQIWRSDERRAA